MSDYINIYISDPESVMFCRRYPSFSIERLVSDYVTSVNKLGLCEASDFQQYIKDTIECNNTSLVRDLRETTKSVVSDVVSSKIERMSDVFTSQLRSVPNDVIVNQLGVVNSKMSNLDLIVTNSNGALKELSESFTDYLTSFKTGSVKGRNTELKTIIQLDSVFPKHDVIHVPSSKQKGKMDIILSLDGYPDISIDTKTYTKSVPKSEVCKFEGDIALGDTHGIMVSTTSKIAGKPHFTIDIIKCNVAVYLSNVGLDTSCIELAVDIIYSLHKVLEGRNGGISSDTVLRIEDLIREDLKRLDKIRESLNVSLVCVKEMTLSRILELLKV
jgi:hypothetical protein